MTMESSTNCLAFSEAGQVLLSSPAKVNEPKMVARIASTRGSVFLMILSFHSVAFRSYNRSPGELISNAERPTRPIAYSLISGPELEN